jgi:hypothetical protein
LRGRRARAKAVPWLIATVAFLALAGCGASSERGEKGAAVPAGKSSEFKEEGEPVEEKGQEAARISKDKELLTLVEAKGREEAAEANAKRKEAAAAARVKKRERVAAKKVKEREAKIKTQEATLAAQAKRQREAARREREVKQHEEQVKKQHEEQASTAPTNGQQPAPTSTTPAG